MQFSFSLANRKFRRAVVMAAVVCMAGISIADSVVVKQEVEVLTKKNALSDPVETVPANTKLEVLATDHGWLRVRTPAGNEGFVSKDDLPVKVDLANAQGNGNVSNLSTTAGGNGLQDDAEAYAKNNNYNKAALEQMIRWRGAITGKDLREFDAAGHVGPAEYRH